MIYHTTSLGEWQTLASGELSGLPEVASERPPRIVERVRQRLEGRGEYMFMRHIIVVLAAVILATVGAAVSASAAEPGETETAATIATCDGTTIELNAEEERTLRLHNQARESRGIRPLCVHPALTEAARSHSADMIRKDYFRHGNVGRRLQRFGYNWITYGENIALGSGSRGSPESIFRSWMKSRGHKSNILNRRFEEVGIGTATGTYKGTSGVTMYTVDFGTRR